MPESVSQLLKLVRALEDAAVPPYPDVEAARRTLVKTLCETVGRVMPEQFDGLKREDEWADAFDRRMEILARRLLAGPEPRGGVIGKTDLRKNAPTFAAVLNALRERPELSAKVSQGFIELHPVPFGLPLFAYKEPLRRALCEYHAAGTLRSMDGTPLKLNTREPVRLWEDFEAADRSGRLAYFPDRLHRENHGGKTKRQIVEESAFPGWQVLLLEGVRWALHRGRRERVGGRAQMEAGAEPRQYVEMVRSSDYAQEHGLTPEAWMSLALVHLEETQGEILNDFQSGTACVLTGAYVPAHDRVPYAFGSRYGAQVRVDGRSSGRCSPYASARSAVRVL